MPSATERDSVAMGLPSGTVTFLFTDIEGSTTLWESAPEAMRAALERHDALLRTAINAHGGHVFSTGGDGLAAVFARSAAQAQAALTAEEWPQDAPVRARMAVHTAPLRRPPLFSSGVSPPRCGLLST
jgi:class 3 adenylate cyclase